MQPTARRSNVIVQQVGTDLVVYDELNDRAHSLNAIAAHVYQHADGTRDLETLAVAATADLGIPADAAVVEEALVRLESVDLIAGGHVGGRPGAIARRDALRRLGLVAAIPLVTSLLVPSPLLARSGEDPSDRGGPPGDNPGRGPGGEGPPGLGGGGPGRP